MTFIAGYDVQMVGVRVVVRLDEYELLEDLVSTGVDKLVSHTTLT